MRKTIRASSLPRIMACPASMQVPEIVISTSSPVADMGTAVHAVMADIITQRLDSVPDLESYITRYDVDRDELRFLAWRGFNIWTQFRDRLEPESVKCEEEHTWDVSFRDRVRLSGHIDVYAKMTDSDTIVVIDWKSGYNERNYVDQLMGYAYLIWPCFPPPVTCSESFKIKIITAWMRSGKWDVLDVSSKDLDTFEKRLRGALLNTERAYSPNDEHCVYCPRALECPARAQLIQSAAHSLTLMGDGDTTALTDRQKLAMVYDQSKMLERALELYGTALRTTIQDNGPLELSDGRVLTLQSNTRDTIHFEDATVSVLTEYLGVSSALGVMEELGPGAVTVKKKALLDAVSKIAPRGSKSDAKKRVLEDLNSAGCVTTTKFIKLTPVQKSALLEEEKRDGDECSGKATS